MAPLSLCVPLLLAVACGSKRMVSAAMEATHIPLWTFGPVKCVKVPLYEVESPKEAILLYEDKPPDTGQALRKGSLSTGCKVSGGAGKEGSDGKKGSSGKEAKKKAKEAKEKSKEIGGACGASAAIPYAAHPWPSSLHQQTRD